MRMMWKESKNWLNEQNGDQKALVDQFVEKVKSFNEEINQRKVDDLRRDDDFHQFEELWPEFMDDLRESNGPLSSFWVSIVQLC